MKFVITNPQVHNEVQAHKDCSTSLLLKAREVVQIVPPSSRDTAGQSRDQGQKDGTSASFLYVALGLQGNSQEQLSVSAITIPWVSLVPHLKA